uniref:Uncharacterized protein n=1 Tax=Knipowitschia caucasica TaxID=637954 RepID=A0AAV2MEF5_KNICA
MSNFSDGVGGESAASHLGTGGNGNVPLSVGRITAFCDLIWIRPVPEPRTRVVKKFWRFGMSVALDSINLDRGELSGLCAVTQPRPEVLQGEREEREEREKRGERGEREEREERGERGQVSRPRPVWRKEMCFVDLSSLLQLREHRSEDQRSLREPLTPASDGHASLRAVMALFVSGGRGEAGVRLT